MDEQERKELIRWVAKNLLALEQLKSDAEALESHIRDVVLRLKESVTAGSLTAEWKLSARTYDWQGTVEAYLAEFPEDAGVLDEVISNATKEVTRTQVAYKQVVDEMNWPPERWVVKRMEEPTVTIK